MSFSNAAVQNGENTAVGIVDISSRSLCILLMAGDGGIDNTRKLLQVCVDEGVQVVELCVPFPNAFTDGEVLQRAHQRALDVGTELECCLPLVEEFSDQLKIVLLVDYSHSVRPRGAAGVLRAAKTSGCAAILPHGLPPRLREEFYQAAAEIDLSVVGTVYPNTDSQTRKNVLRQSGGFIYLVSQFGKSGGSVQTDQKAVSETLFAIRQETALPVAIGFGLKTQKDLDAAFQQGADMCIVGSAATAATERAIQMNTSPRRALTGFLRQLKEDEKHG
ncbi:tryptophan synthase subunit alpha [Motiliproteus sp. MSK22-1]|uniref:tryptophan synthase subunit alpha n=1 Tax=Motiliproteus sp. MSK22-1 TaxID=1897630 RepID=UPI0009757B0A|nr:tryptophan synthase subunit alpha [Motiliproteus sp. MSK22-1]OMH29123.1 tryptophan synthase subunit alpha [Motiliproteus sp. MSK22-1]